MRLQRRSRGGGGVNGLNFKQRTVTQGGEAPLRAWEQQGPDTDQTTCATLSWSLDDLLSVLPWALERRGSWSSEPSILPRLRHNTLPARLKVHVRGQACTVIVCNRHPLSLSRFTVVLSNFSTIRLTELLLPAKTC
jgi:hypothetical protein